MQRFCRARLGKCVTAVSLKTVDVQNQKAATLGYGGFLDKCGRRRPVHLNCIARFSVSADY